MIGYQREALKKGSSLSDMTEPRVLVADWNDRPSHVVVTHSISPSMMSDAKGLKQQGIQRQTAPFEEASL